MAFSWLETICDCPCLRDCCPAVNWNSFVSLPRPSVRTIGFGLQTHQLLKGQARYFAPVFSNTGLCPLSALGHQAGTSSLASCLVFCKLDPSFVFRASVSFGLLARWLSLSKFLSATVWLISPNALARHSGKETAWSCLGFEVWDWTPGCFQTNWSRFPRSAVRLLCTSLRV